MIIIIKIENGDKRRMVEIEARLRVGLTFYYGISFETAPATKAHQGATQKCAAVRNSKGGMVRGSEVLPNLAPL